MEGVDAVPADAGGGVLGGTSATVSFTGVMPLHPGSPGGRDAGGTGSTSLGTVQLLSNIGVEGRIFDELMMRQTPIQRLDLGGNGRHRLRQKRKCRKHEARGGQGF